METNATNHRLFLASGSADAVFAALGSAVAAEAHLDQALLEAVKRHMAANDEYNRCCELDDDHPDLGRLSDEIAAQLEIVLSLPSKTKEGLKAKALVLRRWNAGRTPDVVSPFADHGEQLAWNLANEILAL